MNISRKSNTEVAADILIALIAKSPGNTSSLGDNAQAAADAYKVIFRSLLEGVQNTG